MDITSTSSLTLSELITLHQQHARTHYRRRDGSQTREASNFAAVLKRWSDYAGSTSSPARTNRHQVRAWLDQLAAERLTRGYINACLGKLRRFIRWAADLDYIPIHVDAELRLVRPLQPLRSEARQSAPRPFGPYVAAFRVSVEPRKSLPQKPARRALRPARIQKKRDPPEGESLHKRRERSDTAFGLRVDTLLPHRPVTFVTPTVLIPTASGAQKQPRERQKADFSPWTGYHPLFWGDAVIARWRVRPDWAAQRPRRAESAAFMSWIRAARRLGRASAARGSMNRKRHESRPWDAPRRGTHARPRGWVGMFFLVFMHMDSHRVVVSSVTTRPTPRWTRRETQKFIEAETARAASARTDQGGDRAGVVQGIGAGTKLAVRQLIHDRDGKFGLGFDVFLRRRGVQPIRMLAFAPNLNAHAERFIRTLRSECLDHFLVMGQRHLRHLLAVYIRY